MPVMLGFMFSPNFSVFFVYFTFLANDFLAKANETTPASVLPDFAQQLSSLQPIREFSSQKPESSSQKPIPELSSLKPPSSPQKSVQQPSSKKPIKLGMLTGALWPWKESSGPVVRYYLSGINGKFSNSSLLKQVIAHVEDVSCIRFKEEPSRGDCFDEVDEPTICVSAEHVGDSCFSDEEGCRWGSDYEKAAQTLHMPEEGCPYHEALRALMVALGMLPYHRRQDRNKYLRVTVTAAGTDRLLFAQGQSKICSNFKAEGPYDLQSVTHFDTVGSVLRHGDVMGMNAIEDGMVAWVYNIRHQWVIDHKHYNGLGMSFYDKVALNGAYQCSRLVNCTNNVQCTHGGYVNANCECVCPPSRKGQTCSSSRYQSGVDALESECTVFVNNPQVFTLQDIGLREGNFLFYACDMTVKSPACMRPMIQVNTSSLDPLRSEDNPDLNKSNNWCELYFTIILRQSRLGWRGYCLDYFLNEESLFFMPRSTINTTYGYMKIIVPRPVVLKYIMKIYINISFLEVPGCRANASKSDFGRAVLEEEEYTILTVVGCYVCGLVLGVIFWVVVRALRVRSDSSSSGGAVSAPDIEVRLEDSVIDESESSSSSSDEDDERRLTIASTPPPVNTARAVPPTTKQQLTLPPIESPRHKSFGMDMLRNTFAALRQSFSLGSGPQASSQRPATVPLSLAQPRAQTTAYGTAAPSRASPVGGRPPLGRAGPPPGGVRGRGPRPPPTRGGPGYGRRTRPMRPRGRGRGPAPR